MNQTRTLILITAAMALFWSTGCVRTLKVSGPRKQLASLQKDLGKTVGKVQKDLKEKDEALRFLVTDGMPQKKAPYTKLARQLKKMKAAKKDVNKAQKSVKKKIKRYNKLVGKRKVVRSDQQPLWGQVRKLLKSVQSTVNQVKAPMKNYQKASKAFVSAAKKAGVGKMSVSSVKKKLNRGLKAIRKQVKTTRQSIDEAAAWLGAASSRLGAPETTRRRRILDEMKGLLPKIQAESKKAQGVHGEFVKTVGKRKEVWVGPGTRTKGITARLETHIERINQLARKVTTLGKKFKKKPGKKGKKKPGKKGKKK